MNRLVIIGNGFDLAHGLPTSYGYFIDDFWINFKENCKSDLYKQIVITNDAYDGFYKYYSEINNFRDFKSNLFEYCKEYKYNFYDENCVAIHNMKDIFRIKNDFFIKINNESIENWVDIENLYYLELKKIVKSKCMDVTKTEEYWKKQQKKEVEKLNEEFEQVKNLLEKYLYEKIEKVYSLIIDKVQIDKHRTIYNMLKPISLFNNASTILQEFSSKEDINEIKEIFANEKDDKFMKSKIFFINFNYTNTIDGIYKTLLQDEKTEVFINYIHGQIGNNKENKINFGFGDEMDDDYKSIENINENEYLRNFKSFQYLQNSNYSNLLSYIDSDKFQVLIMGHSCGLSDRTLLNTIFEHNNCRSIKVFYHQWRDKETEEIKDNYTEITQNISRHFNKKKLMREKIVNKTLCQPLPQIQLLKKV